VGLTAELKGRHQVGLKSILFSVLLSVSVVASAQIEVKDEIDPQTPQGSRTPKADQYFKHKKVEREVASSYDSGAGDRYLGLHIGGFLSQEQYKWGTNNSNNVGRLNVGVDYRVGEWVKSMDLLMRVDFFSFSLNEGDAYKLSFLPMLVFPDAASQFPLYFGAGAGMGIFLKQIRGQSALSFDYQVVLGARFFNLLNNMGLSIETGLKNQIHLLSQGQFNSVFLTVGTVFTF